MREFFCVALFVSGHERMRCAGKRRLSFHVRPLHLVTHFFKDILIPAMNQRPGITAPSKSA